MLEYIGVNTFIKREREVIMQINEFIFTKLFKWLKRKDSINEDTIVKETPIAAQQESTKCPQCGNAVELLLPCMGFGDSVVYKVPIVNTQ